MVWRFVLDVPDGFDHVDPAVPQDTFPFLDSSEIDDTSFNAGLFHKFPYCRIFGFFTRFDCACRELHHGALVFGWMIEEENFGAVRAVTQHYGGYFWDSLFFHAALQGLLLVPISFEGVGSHVVSVEFDSEAGSIGEVEFIASNI
jgi:hypothetical protein